MPTSLERTLLSLLQKFSAAGFTSEMAEAADGDLKIVARITRAAEGIIWTATRNPSIQTVQRQLETLRRVSERDGWYIPDRTFLLLDRSAPPWPPGRDCWRMLRVRFGEGEEGVRFTFEAHAQAAARTLGTGFRRWPRLAPGTFGIRLLAGDASHVPTVEWALIRLDAHEGREAGLAGVRGPDSLADEGLAFAWQFPERVRAIDHGRWPSWACAGYELDLPGSSPQPWDLIPCVYRSAENGRPGLHAVWNDDNRPGCRAPILLPA